jgi:hypothetical protein
MIQTPLLALSNPLLDMTAESATANRREPSDHPLPLTEP